MSYYTFIQLFDQRITDEHPRTPDAIEAILDEILEEWPGIWFERADDIGHPLLAKTISNANLKHRMPRDRLILKMLTFAVRRFGIDVNFTPYDYATAGQEIAYYKSFDMMIGPEDKVSIVNELTH